MSDCYARGVVRGAVETANLILHNHGRNAEDAESIKTAQVVSISLGYGLRLMEAAWKEEDLPQERPTLRTDDRFHFHRKGKATKRPSSCPWWT
eukprot:1943514-Amphidinium_carterae.1